MIVYLLGLRERGKLLALPPIRELEDVPPGLVRDGHLDYGSVQGRRGRCLHLRSGMSAPGCGVLAVLYQPTLTQVEHTFLKFRGFEPAEDAVHMQEWLVFPQWLQP